MLRHVWAVAIVCSVGAMIGCQRPMKEEPWQPAKPTKDYARPLPPGQLALRKIPREQYPDFSRGYHDRAGLEQAIRHSLDYLSRPSSRRYFPYGDITHEHAVASLKAFLDVLRDARSPEEFDRLIRDRFDVYQSVGCDGNGTVYFTGYYTPIFEGRKTCDSAFRCPLYGLPPDLVKDSEGQTLGRRTAEGQLVPYWTRREIEERDLLEGLEIAWLKDPFEAYVATVQGSVKLHLADGSTYELGYAGNNGYEYISVGQRLVADGVISQDELSLGTLLRYFATHPDRVSYYCWQNPRTIFFQETTGGPYGSINVPVTAWRTIATDKSVFPRACLAFVDTRLPAVGEGQVTARPYAAFAADQDTGGAIRAAGRSDLYLGIGPEAGRLAGRVGSEGALYYVFVAEGLWAGSRSSREEVTASGIGAP
jgi:membrane-bound lytic murein transglycosylase A